MSREAHPVLECKSAAFQQVSRPRTVQHLATLIKQYFCTLGYSHGARWSCGQNLSTQSSSATTDGGWIVAPSSVADTSREMTFRTLDRSLSK
jgi:hypothetical protein